MQTPRWLRRLLDDPLAHRLDELGASSAVTRAGVSRLAGDLSLCEESRDELERRLGQARAGLLIALPHVEAPAARLLVAYALDASDPAGTLPAHA